MRIDRGAVPQFLRYGRDRRKRQIRSCLPLALILQREAFQDCLGSLLKTFSLT